MNNKQKNTLMVVVLFVGIAAISFILYNMPETKKAVPNNSTPQQVQAQPNTAQPPGATPPGKVWSTEHGHWHDANTGTASAIPSINTAIPGLSTTANTPTQNIPQPAGAVPPGKEWSKEHGHWHDISVIPDIKIQNIIDSKPSDSQ